MASGTDVRGTLTTIIVGLGVEEALIADQARLVRDLELDSTDTVEVSLELKRTLGVEVKLEEISDLTVGEVIRLVDAALIGDADIDLVLDPELVPASPREHPDA